MSFSTKEGYTPQLGLNALEILGKNMYSNPNYAISELVANAMDAKAENIKITTYDDRIEIIDDGQGMSDKDISDKYMNIGSSQRAKDDFETIGRKGIGKLASLFVAEYVEVYTKQNSEIHGFKLSLNEKDLIKTSTGHFFPKLVVTDEIKQTINGVIPKSGTFIKMMKPNSQITPDNLQYRLEIIFAGNTKSKIWVNNKEISLSPKVMKNNIIGVVKISEKVKLPKELEGAEVIHTHDGNMGLPDYKLGIAGWMVVYKTINKSVLASQGIKENVDINKISIYSRGKLGQKDVLPQITKSRVAEKYISGYIDAPIFEEGEDMALPNRQAYSEIDVRFKKLLEILDVALSKLSNKRTQWSQTEKRDKKAEENKIRNSKIQGVKSSIQEKYREVIDVSHLETVIDDVVGELGVGNIEAPALLVSHAEEDSNKISPLIRTLELIGFESHDTAEESENNKRMIVSSFSKYAAPGAEDFWEFIYNECIKHNSNKPGKVLFCSSEKFGERFSVGIEAGMAYAASSVKQRVAIDKDNFNAPGIIKNSNSTSIGNIERIYYADDKVSKRYLIDQLFKLLQEFGDLTKNSIEQAIDDTIEECQDSDNPLSQVEYTYQV